MDDIPLFNSESFVASKPKLQMKFYNDFSSTQIFRQFLQNDTKDNFPYFYKIENNRKNALNFNARQSYLISRTSSLDISKYMHSRSTCNKLLNYNNKSAIESLRKIDISQNNPGKSENNANLNDKSSKDKTKSILINFQNLNFFIVLINIYKF